VSEAGSFWAWSLEIYARPGVAEACLALQDRRGADVNLLLLGLWLATRGRTLPPETAAALADQAATWQREVVRPLRDVRRGLKRRDGDPAVAALRREVAAVELAAERLEQTELERQVRERTCAAPATPATAELSWARLLADTSLDRQWTAPLLQAAFADGDRAGVAASCAAPPCPTEPV
jgi:uncharacterized protein (TIGR02444 family)